ncbi:MAG: hypothetical protein U0230_23530 [Polyangiales bacterium]
MAKRKSKAKSARIYFTQVVSTPSGKAFLAGHMQDQGSEPTFTRFVRADDSGFVHLGDLGAVACAATAIPIEGAPAPGIAVIGRQGPLRIYAPGKPPTDVDVPLRDRTADFLGLCASSDGLLVCGDQRQVLRYADDRWSPIDEGLFEAFDGANPSTLHAIAEVAGGMLVVVGSKGFAARRGSDGAWQRIDVGVAVDLRCVIAPGDGSAWIGGDDGTLLRLDVERGVVTERAEKTTSRSFESLALRERTLFVAASEALWARSEGGRLEKVEGPFLEGSEFHAVSAAGPYLWATGDEHAYRLGPDGWKHFLCPDNA